MKQTSDRLKMVRPQYVLPHKRNNNSPSDEGSRIPARRSVSLILLFFAVTIMAVIVGIIQFFPNASNIQISLEGPSDAGSGYIEMVGAHYSGQTESGVRYELSADRAVQKSDETQVVRLYNIASTVQENAAQLTKLKSNQALYDLNQNRLDLSGNVEIHQSQYDLTLQTDMMTVFVERGDLLTDQPVKLSSPDMSLKAGGMRTQNQTQIVTFTGETKLIIKQTTD